VSHLILEPRLADWDPAAPARDAQAHPSVAVVITTYNHAHFLADAIDSVLAQTEAAAEIIVVDDGSSDDPASVTGRYPSVRLIRQANQGLASARNTGLHAVGSDKVIFLDADDRLLPRAVAAGLACCERAPDAGLVYGGHRRIDHSGRALGPDRYEPISHEPYRDLLRGNPIGMHATAMYDTRKLKEAGGFDGTLPRCEDYDLYLRMSRIHPILSHPETIAEYRWHGSNMSGNERDMLHWVLHVHARQQPNALPRSATAEDWHAGRQVWREYYAGEILKRVARTRPSLAGMMQALADALIASPRFTVTWMSGVARRRILRLLPQRWVYWLRRLRGRRPPPPVGSVRFGDFNRVKPISHEFGYDRGAPIDRYYIETFLQRHGADIQGRALEVGDDSYCRRFGGSRVTQQDVLHVTPGAAATITGDLSQPGLLPEAAFDCMVVTQTLHFIYDLRGAVAEIHRGLKPGGVVLVTVPGISQIDRHEMERWGDYWRFTSLSARVLFESVFGVAHVTTEIHGNVLTAAALLYGLASNELSEAELGARDPDYEVIIAIRAVKALP